MNARAEYSLGVGCVGKSLRALSPDVFSEMMRAFVGMFNSDWLTSTKRAMLLFGKQAAAVSDTTQIQSNWRDNIDSVNTEQPKESGDKTLPALSLSRGETWKILPNSLASYSRGCSVGTSKDCRTNSISWSLSWNHRINTFYVTCQLAAFSTAVWLRPCIIRRKEASPASLASRGWPRGACASAKSSVPRS